MGKVEGLPKCPDHEKRCTFKVGVFVCAIEHKAVTDDGRQKMTCYCPVVNYDG